MVAGTLTVAWSRHVPALPAPARRRPRVDVDERYAGRAIADADAFPIEHGQIDLAPMVREDVLLGVPDAPLCRDDCPGLCPTCGADLADGPCGCDTADARRALGRARPLRRDD